MTVLFALCFCPFKRDYNISESARLTRFVVVLYFAGFKHGKRQHVGRRVLAAVFAVKLVYFVIVRKGNRNFAGKVNFLIIESRVYRLFYD